jgi:hypothetical protein
MPKPKTHAKLKKELDAVFSKYIRWYFADANGYVECYTCGQVKPVKQMQNGHFQSRRSTSTRFEINNCRPQCVKCNMFEQGQQYLFGQKLKAEIGAEAVEEIIALSRKSVKYSKADLEYLIDLYKQKLKDLDIS